MGFQDLTLTLGLTAASLLAVSFPLLRGFSIALRGFAATRPLPPKEIGRLLEAEPHGPDTVAVSLLRVLRSALRESDRAATPTEFVIDASRQYVSNDYEAHYARPLSMCANILPPLGFIGTTGGLLILFLSMHVASDSLELGALALALTSSIFALVGFAGLEGLKFRLYRRHLARLDEATTLFRTRIAKGT